MNERGGVNDWPIFVNGQWRRGDEPVLSALDQGFTLGLAVFDSLVFEAGTCLFLEAHMRRLARGARGIGLAWPPPFDPGEVLPKLAARIGESPLVLRTTYSRGAPGGAPSFVVSARPVTPPPAEGIALYVPAERIVAVSALDGLKSTNRIRNVLAREEAAREGAWEALLVDAGGRPIEGTIANVWARLGSHVWTPPLDVGCLGGITREQVLGSTRGAPIAEFSVGERAFTLGELGRADEVFLTNSSGRAFGVHRFFGPGIAPRELPGARGPAVAAVRARLEAIERAYRERTRAQNA